MADKTATKNVSNVVSIAEIQKLLAFIVPSLGGVITALTKDGHVGWGTIIAAAVSIVIGVPAVFHPSNVWVKGGLAFVTAGLQALALLVTDATGLSNLHSGDWLMVVGTAIGAVLAIYVPNGSTTGAPDPGVTPDPAADDVSAISAS